jgi:hypothetical protein
MRRTANGRRIFALADYTVERTGRGWYFGRTSRNATSDLSCISAIPAIGAKEKPDCECRAFKDSFLLQ